MSEIGVCERESSEDHHVALEIKGESAILSAPVAVRECGVVSGRTDLSGTATCCSAQLDCCNATICENEFRDQVNLNDKQSMGDCRIAPGATVATTTEESDKANGLQTKHDNGVVNVNGSTESTEANSKDSRAAGGKTKRSAVGFSIDVEHTQTVTQKLPQGSLQECFARLQKQKQELLRSQNSPWAIAPVERQSQERLSKLRAKFVAQARRYIGVPYARKYWQPEEPEYSAPMFLDCCGLVRQVVRDLRDDFGFAIGPWNQAYMWDTLPTEYASASDMQPGDLVFVTGTYHKGKQQKHLVTHVEIWLADGERTLGARWWRGKVQVFDTFRFQPSTYHSHQYHFKSIDPWLAGECRSHCKEHKWLTRQLKLSSRSVFALSADSSSSVHSTEADVDADAESNSDEDECAQNADNA